MWTPENRARYKREHLRSPSDTTDAIVFGTEIVGEEVMR